MKKKHIVHIVGARPNFVKLAPLWRVIASDPDLRQTVIHTGQHFSHVMSDAIFRDLELPPPDIHLGVETSNYLEQIAMIIQKLLNTFTAIDPDVIVVYGDVNSTLAGALAAKKAGLPLIHIEAGLRSNDVTMPEERNRIIVDHIADHLFTTSDDAAVNLKKEGVSDATFFHVGNLMVDSLYFARTKALNAPPSPTVKTLLEGVQNFALLTLHRPGNVDDRAGLAALFAILAEVGERIPIVFPVHPRTTRTIETFSLGHFGRIWEGVLPRTGMHFLPPLSYLEFIRLYDKSRFVLTDSGGVQEETSVLGIPCLTLRDNTERPVTVELGTNTVVGTSREAVLKYVNQILCGEYKRGSTIPWWDGHAGERAVQKIKMVLGD